MLLERPAMRPIAWMGSAFDYLLSFPEAIRKDAGFQLHRLQAGLEAADWKPMPEIGKGVAENTASKPYGRLSNSLFSPFAGSD